MRIIRAGEYRRMRWKNGGGETAEIAVSPPGAALDAFDWRISMARVEADGPFSLFPGIDRTLLILEGSGVSLAVAGRPAVDLTPASDPLPFPGDVAATARLIAGPVGDLNVMTRRGRLSHEVTRHRLVAPVDLAIDAQVVLLLCHAGFLRVETPAGAALLGPLDSLLAEDRPRGPWHVAADGVALAVAIEIAVAGAAAA